MNNFTVSTQENTTKITLNNGVVFGFSDDTFYDVLRSRIAEHGIESFVALLYENSTTAFAIFTDYVAPIIPEDPEPVD